MFLYKLHMNYCPITIRDEVNITVSDSTGSLHVYQLCGDRLEVITHWTGHDFEAWITAFDQWNTQLIYSGLLCKTPSNNHPYC